MAKNGQMPCAPEMSDCVHALCRWRDEQARRDDDSPQYVLPDPLVLALSSSRPTSAREIRWEPNLCRTLQGVCLMGRETIHGPTHDPPL